MNNNLNKGQEDSLLPVIHYEIGALYLNKTL